MTVFVRFGSEYDCLDYLVEGWSDPEAGFVWSNGKRSIVSLPRPDAFGDAVMQLKVKPYRPQHQPFQPFSVVVNGSIVGECIVRDDAMLEFFLPASMVARYDALEIVFYFYAPLRPADIGDSDDRRLLCLALIELRVDELRERKGDDLINENLLIAPASVCAMVADQRAEDQRWASRITDPTRSGGLSLPLMIEGYVRGAGAAAHLRQRISNAIGAVLGADPPGGAPKPPTLDDDQQLNREIVQLHASPFGEFLFDYEDTDKISVEEVLPGGRNQAYFPGFPFPFASGIIRPERPTTLAFSARDATAYVHPYNYAIYATRTAKLWPRANPQGLSKFILSEKKIDLDQDVVIVQDQFDGGNFAHFLFDSITRMYHFAELRPSIMKSSLFVFGGCPVAFHKLILAMTCIDLGVDQKQVFFPQSGWNIRSGRSIYAFSDQTIYFHPAQMMHPHSVAILRRLAQQLPHESKGADRIYISRSDAGHRRLSNEAELVVALTAIGFVSVRLSRLPILEQIHLVSNASVIVGPHGMGFTHLAFHQGRPTVMELFHPNVGSDDYAFLSRAFDFDYHYITGSQTNAHTHDFTVDVEQVMETLRNAGVGGV